jgi:cystathionine beta-lyase
VTELPDPFEGVTLESLRRRRGTKWSRDGCDVIPAWIADADTPVAPPVRAAIDALLDRGDLTYPPDDQARQVAETFADRMAARYGWHPDPAAVLLAADLRQLLSVAVDRLTAPGDGVMMHVPAYPPFLEEVAGLGRRVVPLRWEPSGSSWVSDLEEITAAAERGARLLILVNPHNPTGRSWSREELDALAAIVLEWDLLVISDEVHGDLQHPPHRHTPFASLSPEVAARTLTFTSASKSHNLPGVRCAIGHLGDSPDFDPLRAVPASQWGQISNVGMTATLAAWSPEGDAWGAAFAAAITARRDRFAAALAHHLPEVGHRPPEATFLAWVDARPLGLPIPPAEWFLDRARLALGVGETFGPGGEGRVRVNLATTFELLDEIVERMVTAIDLWRAA